MANIKGSVLRSRLDFVRSHAGDDGLERVLSALPDPDRRLLTRELTASAEIVVGVGGPLVLHLR